MSWRTAIATGLRRTFDRNVNRAAGLVYSVLPIANPKRYGTRVVRDLSYRDTGKRSHLLDVYLPLAADHAPRPLVVYVHGGAFSMLSKDTHRMMALAFASRGYVVFNINYRLGPRNAYPAPLEDAAAALSWAVDHAREHGADPTRIVLAGESAGANLVTALTYCATHPREEPFARALYDRNLSIRAVLAMYGLHDMHDIARLWRNKPRLPRWMRAELAWAAAAYVGRPLKPAAERAPLASPLRRLAEPPAPGARPLPPFFAAVGTADPLLPDSVRLRDVLRARGVVCELSIHPGEIHGFNAMMWRPAAQAKWRRVFNFLERHVPIQDRVWAIAPGYGRA